MKKAVITILAAMFCLLAAIYCFNPGRRATLKVLQEKGKADCERYDALFAERYVFR